MAKGSVLGNDPFKRGAAERTPAEAPDTKAAAPAPAKFEKPKGAAKRAAKARPAKKVEARPEAKPIPLPREDRPAAKSAAAKKKVEAKKAAPSKPAPKKTAKKPAPTKVPEPVEEPVLEPAGAEVPPVVDAEPVPAEEVAAPAMAIEAVIVEGVIVDEIPSRPPRALPQSASVPEESSRAESGGFLAKLRATAEKAATSAVEKALSSQAGQKAFSAVASNPVLQTALSGAFTVARSAGPAVVAALRTVPPALDVARSAVGALVTSGTAKGLIDTAAEATDAARRVIRRVEPAAMEVDLFGEDPTLLSRAEPLLDFFYERYFRVEALGAENVPEGACLLVCNHSGALPIDGLMVRTALRQECRRADARWLVEDAIFHAPFMGVWFNRLGAVRACPENAERLLADGNALAVFPEGILGIGKRISERYRLQRFGRGGFVKLAMRAGVPIVPVAIVGAEEASPLLAKIPAKAFGVPYIPVTPTFPLLGPLGLMPLPTRWTISFLPPVDVSAHGAQGAEDHALVARHTTEIREGIQRELDRLVDARPSVFAS